MIQSSGQNYEYHITILSVKMKVKFPCRMKIEHQGSLLTGQCSPSEDNRYVFNQLVILKDQNQLQFFEITINLVTEKGAKYIAGIIKLYQSELVRSEGQRIVLSLTKCIDSQAFCQIRVDQIANIKSNKHVPYDRKSTVQRDVPLRQRQVIDMDFSPHKSAYNVKIQQSKSEYQFPLHQNGRGARHEWDTKSKSRMVPPSQTAFPKSKNGQRINYANNLQHGLNGFQLMGQSGMLSRQKAMEGEVYKQGYQKLKQKYKRQAELNKQELNKRLALENNQNNLKLQIMRFKMKCEEQQKSLNDRNSKLKELQTLIGNLQQKQSDNIYLRDEIAKKDNTIRALQDKVRAINRSLEQFKDLAYEKNSDESNRNKELQIEIQNLKIRFQSRERQLQKENKIKVQLLHEKEMQLVSKSDSLERQKKTVGDLEKAIQNKQFQLEKLLQNERNSHKAKLQDQKSRFQKLQREFSKIEDLKKQISKQLQVYKNNSVKLQYDKKLLSQELQSLRSDYSEAKGYKDKFIQISRDHRSIIEERTHLERQLERTIQNKQSNLSQINKQFQDQMQYYKKMNRELDQKVKNQSNKLIQVEGQLQLSRNQQDKLRRSLESSVKEAAEAKQKQKSARKALKVKEQEALSTETEQATLKQKLKSIDQIYKLQVDKFKDQIDKIRMQYENEVDKNQELQQTNNQLNMELNKIKIKMQYADERSEKDGANLREKQIQVEAMIKDYQQQISALDQTVNALRLSEKQLSTKLQKSELQQIKNQEKIDRMKKQTKVLQERCNNLDNTLKTKLNQMQILALAKQNLEKKSAELQLSQAELKNQGSISLNQKNKLTKINEMINQEIKKSKTQNTQLATALSEREKQEQELRNILKNEKEEVAKLDLKHSTYKKEVQRSKDALFETIQKWLFTLPLGGKDENKRNVELLLNKKPTQNSFSQYFNMIISHTKDIKQCLVKQFDLIKQLEREKQRLQEQVAASSNKYQNAQVTLKKQIDELQIQLQHIIEQKQIEITSYGQNIDDLEERIRELSAIEDDLNNQLEELNFTNNSMKMDYEAMNEQNNKKIANLRKLNTQLQDKLEYQVMTVSDLDDKCGLLQADVDNLQSTVENLNEANSKKDKLIDELREALSINQRNIEQFKKNKKQLTERISQLEMHLNTQKELNDKSRQLMIEQESKSSELKLFISNLMKQKENAIKSDLQKSQNVMMLEANLLELNKQLELLKEENQKNVKNLEIQKQANKKLTINLKDSQSEKKQQKSKHLKTQEKLRQKQKELLAKEEASKKQQIKAQKTIQKLKGQIKQLQQQLQIKNSNNFEQTKDTNEKIIQLEGQIQKKNSSITALEAKIVELQQKLFSQKQKSIQNQQLISKLKNQNEQFRAKIYSMDTSLNDKEDELNLKQQKLFQFSGRVYSLEHKLQSVQQEHQQVLQYLNRQFNNKYDSLLQEYQQRLDLIQKQRDYLKNLCEQKDKDIARLNSFIKSQELSESNNRKSYEQKIKKLEDDRLALLSIKNTELQRANEENKSLLENNKARESENRRLTNQLEVARKTITNLDQKAKQYDEKIKGVNRVYQTELEQLKKKDVATRAYKEAIINYHWNIERQIKKGVQNFIKNFLEISQDKNSQKILDLARALQKSFVEALADKPQQK